MQVIRKKLIKQAADAAAELSDRKIYELTLTPPTDAYRRVREPIERAAVEGSRQVASDAAKSTPVNRFERKTVIDDLIRRLVDLTISRIVTEVSTAASNIIAQLGILGLDRDEIEQRVERDLEDRSDAPFEGIARQAINAAVNGGRREEMDSRSDDIDHYVYSAILDKAVCENCEEWDGKESTNIEDLPETPNPECLGMSNCRCFIISVFSSEA